MQIDAQGIEKNLVNFTICNYKKIIRKKYQKTHFHSIERKFETKIYFGRMKQLLEYKYSTLYPKKFIFSHCFKSSDQPQEDLTKSNYKKKI
jgi:hypothetical protein